MKKLIEIIKDKKTVLICPSAFKNRVLEYLSENKEIADIKFIDLNEYRKNRLFDYGLDAVKYLVDRHGLSVSNSKEILNNIYYVEDKEYGNEKLDNLMGFKKELENNDLLIRNELFDRFLEDREIIVIGYGSLNRSDNAIIKGKIIPYEEKERKYRISRFENIEEEIEYVYNAVSDLITAGTDINRIHILNANADYESYFARFNTYYGFKIDYRCNEKLIGIPLAKDFLDMIDTLDKQDIYSRLAEAENDQADKLIGIINRYTDYDLKDVKEFIVEDLRNTDCSTDIFTDVVRCEDLFTPFGNDDHVFLIGFNDQFPAFKTDTEYITNNLRPILNMSSVEEENELIRKNVRGYLSGIDKLHISYCEKSPFRKYNQNNLYSNDECEFIKVNITDYSHSEKLNRLRYAYMQDRLQKYALCDEDYSLFQKYYGSNDYRSYSNAFKGLGKDQIRQLDKVKLSYTRMNDFYLCSFRYYLDYVLKIADNTGNYNTRIGNITHVVLKDLYTDPDFDFDRSWDEAYRNEEAGLDEKEKLFEDEAEEFFAKKIKEELRKDVQIIEKQKQMTLLDKQLCEEYIRTEVAENISFDGKIDKVMYREGSENVVANVVDYKTGNSSDIDRRLMEFGLSLQLPSYMYLLSKKDLFNGKKLDYGGFYLQHLISNERKYDESKTLEDLKNESMKFDGFTTDDPDRLEITDPDLKEGDSSRLYRTVKKKNDGSLHSNSNTMSDEEIKEKIKLVEEKIIEAGEQIQKGNFNIDPKKYNNKNISCDYCPYLDICYRSFVYELKPKEAEDDGREMD